MTWTFEKWIFIFFPLLLVVGCNQASTSNSVSSAKVKLTLVSVSDEIIGNDFSNLQISNSILYAIVDFQKFVAIDVSNPEDLNVLNEFIANGQIKDYVIQDDKAILYGAEFGLIILDIRNPRNINRISEFNYQQETSTSLQVWKNYIYAHEREPRNIKDTGRWNLIKIQADQSLSFVKQIEGLGEPIEIYENYVLSLKESPTNSSVNYLQIVDVSNPVEPKILSDHIEIGDVISSKLISDFLVLSNGTVIVDLSNPFSPKIISRNSSGSSSIAMNEEGLIIQGYRSLKISSFNGQDVKQIVEIPRDNIEAVVCDRLFGDQYPFQTFTLPDRNLRCLEDLANRSFTYVDLNDLLFFENLIVVGTSDVGLLVFEKPVIFES